MTDASTDCPTSDDNGSKSSREDDDFIVFEEQKVSETREPSDKRIDKVLNNMKSKRSAMKKQVRT